MSEKARIGVIHISTYIHEIGPTGETEKVETCKELKNFIITIGPAEKSSCIDQIKEFLEKIKKIEK